MTQKPLSLQRRALHRIRSRPLRLLWRSTDPKRELASSGFALAVFVLSVAAAPGMGDAAPPPSSSPAPESAASGADTPEDSTDVGSGVGSGLAEALPYHLDLRVKDSGGGEAAGLRAWLEQVSRLQALKDDPPSTVQGLQRRLDSDLDRFQGALRARGYYQATLAADLHVEERPAQVVVTADPGPLYTLTRVRVEEIDGQPLPLSPQRPEESAEAAGLSLGAPAAAQGILDGDQAVALFLQRRGYPLAKVVDRGVVVDHGLHSMDVTYKVSLGPVAVFGPLEVSGLEGVKESYIKAMVPWHPGERYDEGQIRAFRQRLSETRLFSTIDLGPAEAVTAEGEIPIRLAVSEGAPRTISAGVSYATDQGPGVTGRWEHRNFFGEGELFRLDAVGALSEQSLNTSLRKPFFLDPRQTLTASAQVARQDMEAFTGLVFKGSTGVERQVWDHWRMSAAVAFESAHLTWPDDDEETQRTHALAALPLTATRDATDSLLDPTIGTRFSLGVTPFLGMVRDEPRGFVVTDASASAYTPVIGKRVVLAGRIRLASLTGAESSHVPPTRRLYAGGGGSVRGFGHQMIGPLATDGDPLGGRSAAEIGGELRIKLTDTIAVVPFLEGGMVGPDPWPSFDEPVRWGGGLGVRYHTDFGPLRVDFGVPLNPRKQDDNFQIYISLGQAF